MTIDPEWLLIAAAVAVGLTAAVILMLSMRDRER